MQILGQIQHYGFWFLVVLTILVFIHELGHFLVARLCGVRVEVFSIGFGPELFGFTDRTGTRWKISWLPFGGYVRMFGQDDNVLEGESLRPMTPAERTVSFRHKGIRARMAIVAAGPAANYVFAIVVLALVYAFVGKPHSDPVIGAVLPHSAAEAAGLKPGDRFVALNGTPVHEFDDLVTIVQLNLDKPLAMTIDRNGQQLQLTAHPQILEVKDFFGDIQRTPRLGVSAGSAVTLVKLNPIQAIGAAGVETYTESVVILTGAWQMLSGQRPSDEVRGVAGIAKMAGDVASLGFISFMMFAVMLSVNLGLINLFPVPMLDGGHLAYYAIEGIRGRPLAERTQELGLKIGLALVLSLMLFATWNDLVYLKVVDFVKSLFT